MIDENRLIEELKESNYHHASNSREEALLDRVIRIVQEQPKVNEWIPVTESLPEEHDSIFAKFKGTDTWEDVMFEKKSNDVNVTIESDNGKRIIAKSCTYDGVWDIETKCRLVKRKVIAWMPLPKPYEVKENE